MSLRHTLHLSAAVSVIALSGMLLVASAQQPEPRGSSFEIVNSTIGGGGGTSSGNTYTLTGTIGQPDAGAMTGGSYQLQGGFWHGGIENNCPADLANSDGLINVFDLFVLLGNWGTGGSGANLAPNESVVDVFDLFVLLSAWGACE